MNTPTITLYEPPPTIWHETHPNAPCCWTCCKDYIDACLENGGMPPLVEHCPFAPPKERWRHFDPKTSCESEHPWFWQMFGVLVVRWKLYEERMIQTSGLPVRRAKKRWSALVHKWSWWFACEFSMMATPHDYFWPFMCPHCSYDCNYVLENFDSPWYVVTDSGTSFNGDYTCHWFEGIVTCPRCLQTWDYGDSD